LQQTTLQQLSLQKFILQQPHQQQPFSQPSLKPLPLYQQQLQLFGNKMAAGERRASARTSALAKRREGTPEVLRLPEKESFELDISLDLDDRDIVFSSPVSSILIEEKKKEADDELEKIADRLVATLNAACSKKKKKKR
jgi:hypothetical protein